MRHCTNQVHCSRAVSITQAYRVRKMLPTPQNKHMVIFILLYCLKLRIILSFLFFILDSSIHKSAWLPLYIISYVRLILIHISTVILIILWMPGWWYITKSFPLIYQTVKIFFCNWSNIRNWFLSKMSMDTLHWASGINRLNFVIIAFPI